METYEPEIGDDEGVEALALGLAGGALLGLARLLGRLRGLLGLLGGPLAGGLLGLLLRGGLLGGLLLGGGLGVDLVGDRVAHGDDRGEAGLLDGGLVRGEGRGGHGADDAGGGERRDARGAGGRRWIRLGRRCFPVARVNAM